MARTKIYHADRTSTYEQRKARRKRNKYYTLSRQMLDTLIDIYQEEKAYRGAGGRRRKAHVAWSQYNGRTLHALFRRSLIEVQDRPTGRCVRTTRPGEQMAESFYFSQQLRG